MVRIIARLIAAWPQVAKRSLAHWRLVSTVVIGVFLASAIMAGTVIYFDALRELALKSALSKLTDTETDILLKADRGPTNESEYAKVARVVNGEVDARIQWFLKDVIRGGKSATFFLTEVGNEEAAGLDNARAIFVFSPRFEGHIELVPGSRMPVDLGPGVRGEPLFLEAVIPQDAADVFGVQIGDTLAAVPHWDDAIPYAHVIVTGIFRRDDPNNEFWSLDRGIFQATTSGNFRTAPFYIAEETYMRTLGASFVQMDSTYGWLLDVDTSRISADTASLAELGVRSLRNRLSTDLFSYRQLTLLDEALREFDQRLFFSKIPMFVVLILIAVVILYYVVTISTMLVEQQRGEIALLRSRGASAAQVLAVYVLEGATISLLSVIVAPLLAAFVISLLGFTPAFSGLSGSSRLSIDISANAYLMSALGGLLSFAALLIPAIQASRVSVTRHRQQAARPTSQPFFQRFYLDIMLLVVSVVLFRQLSEQGSVVATGVFGEVAINQALLAVPALVLVALALVLLRLFPLAVRYLSGDSPAVINILVAGTVLILVPTIAITETLEGGSAVWAAQVALILVLAGAYWATQSAERLLFKLAGMAIQAGAIAGVLLVGPDLPIQRVFAPILIGIVPAQLVFIFLQGYARRAPVGFSLGMWQMARNPTHYARLSLLLILMAGLGIFAASFGGTLERSFEERALYSSGADLRVDGLLLDSRGATRPVKSSYQTLPGVQETSLVVRRFGTDLSKLLGEQYMMFSVESDVFAEIGWFRDDFAGRPIADLLGQLDHPNAPRGIELPGNARSIGAVVKSDRPQPSVALTVRIKDVNDRYFTYFLGTLDSSDWTRLEASLSRQGFLGQSPLVPTPPLTLVTVSFHELNGGGRLRAGSALIDQIHVGTSSGGTEVLEAFERVDEWSTLRASPEAVVDALEVSDVTFDGDTGSARFIWAEGSPLVSRGIFHGPPVEPLPVLATPTFFRDTGHRIGEVFEVSVSGHRLLVRIVDSVDYFPTLDTADTNETGFLISDLESLVKYTNLETTTSELRPNEVWISTNGNGAERERLKATLADGRPFSIRGVIDRNEMLAESQVDPLVKAGWRALLFMAFGAVLILSALGFLVHAYVSFRERQLQFALMRTIGFSLRQLVALVWLEQALVIAAGMALGTWMGGRLGEIIMPFLAHDDTGGRVLPPFILQVNWVTLAVTYAAMTLAFVIIITGVVWFIRRISLQRILRLGEM
ncbi:MAG: ABC transporter permease [Chloroflexi bacterium]|nr:ABC transporter permease [Chloroflexota bacterium]